MTDHDLVFDINDPYSTRTLGRLLKDVLIPAKEIKPTRPIFSPEDKEIFLIPKTD